MRERFSEWVRGVSAWQALAALLLCLVVAGAFGLGMLMARAGRRSYAPAPQSMPADAFPRPRGTYGAIDRIEGNLIRLRDARSGRVWTVRAGNETVIEFGPRRRIPLQALRPGQRVFVIGAPQANGLDASFIGVVGGQNQYFIAPSQLNECADCVD